MQAIWSFSCSLAITRSSLFGLHLGRKTFQNSFYTWVTVSKMSNWNIKSHELLRKMYKAKQSQDRKRLKLVNVLITKKKNIVLRVWEWRVRGFTIVQKSALEKGFFFVFFSLSLGFSHTCNCLLRTYSKRLTGEIWLGKYHFPAKYHFACCESQRLHILLAGGL